MYKLIILFDQPDDPTTFGRNWEIFLRMAEQMPGLRRENTSRIDRVIFGGRKMRPHMIHEFHFDDRAALDAALASDAGQQAGEWLHQFTGGNFVLLSAPHHEATENEIKKTSTPKKKVRARSG